MMKHEASGSALGLGFVSRPRLELDVLGPGSDTAEPEPDVLE
jgi:hypothetical protein